jgi:hypothetical protein
MDNHMQLFFANLRNTRIIYPNWENGVMRKRYKKGYKRNDLQDEISFGKWLRKQRRVMGLSQQDWLIN